MEYITSIVKEEGITREIFRMKEELERVDKYVIIESSYLEYFIKVNNKTNKIDIKKTNESIIKMVNNDMIKEEILKYKTIEDMSEDIKGLFNRLFYKQSKTLYYHKILYLNHSCQDRLLFFKMSKTKDVKFYQNLWEYIKPSGNYGIEECTKFEYENDVYYLTSFDEESG